MKYSALILAAAMTAVPFAATAQTTVPVPRFDSVELRDGGHVTLKYGPQQRVTLLSGSTQFTTFRSDEPGKLVIETCNSNCPHTYKMEVEIVTPDIRGAAVSQGGEIDSTGGFPAQDNLSAAADEGGIVDLHNINARSVDAAVNQGGQVKVNAQETLRAAVNEGGEVIYWGNPQISEAVNDGGDVRKGG